MLWSPPDIALVLGIALLVFGPKRLPEFGQSLGQGIGKFKKSLAEAESSLSRTDVVASTSLPLSSPDTSVVRPPISSTTDAHQGPP
jgi:sec-independent protein translocase protein TatA